MKISCLKIDLIVFKLDMSKNAEKKTTTSYNNENNG